LQCLLDSAVNTIKRTNLPHIDAYRAVRLAIRRLSPRLRPLDWEILIGLYEAGNALSFSGVFNLVGDGRPRTLSNANFYDALDRMVVHAVILETKRPNGWRQWAITAKGRKAVKELNVLAEKLLQDGCDQSGK